MKLEWSNFVRTLIMTIILGILTLAWILRVMICPCFAKSFSDDNEEGQSSSP